MQAVKRYLHFDNIDLEQPDISSQCSQCGETFQAGPKLGEELDDVIFRIRAEYDAHECRG